MSLLNRLKTIIGGMKKENRFCVRKEKSSRWGDVYPFGEKPSLRETKKRQIEKNAKPDLSCDVCKEIFQNFSLIAGLAPWHEIAGIMIHDSSNIAGINICTSCRQRLYKEMGLKKQKHKKLEELIINDPDILYSL